MAAKAKKEYGNESISTLKGADRVRKRPGVIFRLHSAFVLQHFRQHNGAREEGNAHAALVVRSENFNGPIGRTFDDTHTQRTSE